MKPLRSCLGLGVREEPNIPPPFLFPTATQVPATEPGMFTYFLIEEFVFFGFGCCIVTWW